MRSHVVDGLGASNAAPNDAMFEFGDRTFHSTCGHPRCKTGEREVAHRGVGSLGAP